MTHDRDVVAESRAATRIAALLRLLAVYLALGGLFIAARPTPASVSVGFLIIVIGESIRIWAAGHLRKTIELVTSGPYRYTRNPMYLGRLLIFTGVAIMAWLPGGLTGAVLLAGWTVFFLYYLRRKERVEPARLLAVHGNAYARYREEVPALWPRITPYRAGADAAWSSERLLINREHWMVIALVFVTLALLARAYKLEAGSSLELLLRS